jgi:hypothetical protein
MKMDIRKLGCRYVSWNADRIHLQIWMVTRMNLQTCTHIIHRETTACYPYLGGRPVTYSCGQSLFGSYSPALPACRGRGCGLDSVSETSEVRPGGRCRVICPRCSLTTGAMALLDPLGGSVQRVLQQDTATGKPEWRRASWNTFQSIRLLVVWARGAGRVFAQG